MYSKRGLAVIRVRRMERVFDILSANKDKINQSEVLRGLFKRLVAYYDGGKWLFDYTLDEKGLLPKSLKRGVLSEDGVYNLITEIDSILK